MKLIFALIFVVLTTALYANPLGEDFTDGERSNGNLQPKDDADKLSVADDEEYLEDENNDDDGDDDDVAVYKSVGKSIFEQKNVRVNCHCVSVTA